MSAGSGSHHRRGCRRLPLHDAVRHTEQRATDDHQGDSDAHRDHASLRVGLRSAGLELWRCGVVLGDVDSRCDVQTCGRRERADGDRARTGRTGEELGTIIEGNRRSPVTVRLAEHTRNRVDELKRLPVRVGEGGLLPLGNVAELRMGETVAAITREYGQRRAAVLVNLRGRDIESFVREAQEKIASGLELPSGYAVEFGGQFKNLIEAKQRLKVVVPVALALILALIWFTFRSVRQTLLISVCVPLAATGGVFALWLRDLPFSISAGVGFIALSGVAVLGDVGLVSTVRQYVARGKKLQDAIQEAAQDRLRPVLMTALVAAIGFLPMALNTGFGAEVQRPLATVVIGGVISSTILTLIVLPVLYSFVRRGAQDELTERS